MSDFGIDPFGSTAFAGGDGAAPTVVGSIPPPVINAFAPSVPTITSGGSTSLEFDVTDATIIQINGIPVTGTSLTVSPTTTTTFVLSAINSGGTTSEEITVVVTGSSLADGIRYHQIRRGDREGDGHEFQMSAAANPAIAGYPAVYTDNENIIARQPRGNTTAVQLADQTGGYTEGNLLDFDPYGNTRDSGISSASITTILSEVGPWVEEVPSGTLNGTNLTFTLSFTPILGSLTLF
jgi:hypothetical protein